jgi:hypothetical protein
MRRRHVIVPVLLLALAAPASASAATGGSEFVEPPPAYATASDGAVSIKTKPAGLQGVRKTVTGTIPARHAGRIVTIERYDELVGDWSPITHTEAGAKGTFSATWKPARTGALRLRARVESRNARLAAAAPELDIMLYKPETATWYGPGFFGRKTACGQKMTETLQGVAHRTLKCGTPVEILYKGRTVTVPVVDRGPFANGASYDLTQATAEALGVAATVRIGALPQPG